jgi:predicted glycosyltransferase
MGLGHLRRNLRLAETLGESPLAATSLLVTGAHEANFFAMPPRVGVLTLPRLAKDESGAYTSGHLDMSLDGLLRLRAEAIRSALDAFAPNLVVVDKAPTGAFGEMLPALRRLRRRGVKLVLGVRDILDEPECTRREWGDAATQRALHDLYDQIWVYGDPRVYDPAREYGWASAVAAKVRYTGYLQQPRGAAGGDGCAQESLRETKRRHVVCSVGGGQDGWELAQAFVDGLPNTAWRGTLITGPYMPDEHVERLRQSAAGRSNLELVRFSADAERLLRSADKLVSMGGYNSICELLSFGKPALVAPRVKPRLEQWIRAERLAALGLIDVVHPDRLSAQALADWIRRPTNGRIAATNAGISLEGLGEVRRLAADLVGPGGPAASWGAAS